MLARDAERAFDVLVKHAGAHESDRAAFIRYTTEEERGEFRFCGALGYGGKFWFHPDDGWRVSCYREDETRKRMNIVAKTNGALLALWLLKEAVDHD